MGKSLHRWGNRIVSPLGLSTSLIWRPVPLALAIGTNGPVGLKYNFLRPKRPAFHIARANGAIGPGSGRRRYHRPNGLRRDDEKSFSPRFCGKRSFRSESLFQRGIAEQGFAREHPLFFNPILMDVGSIDRHRCRRYSMNVTLRSLLTSQLRQHLSGLSLPVVSRLQDLVLHRPFPVRVST